MKRALPVALGLALLPTLAWGAKVKVWHHYSSEHHDKAEFKQAVLTTEGTLRLARQVKPLPGIDAAHVWAMESIWHSSFSAEPRGVPSSK